MIPLVMIVPRELLERHPQVPFPDRDDPIQALLFHRPDESLRVGVTVRRTRRRAVWLSKTPYTLCRLRLRTFSDSLVPWHPSSSRCSTHFDSSFDHGFCYTWKSSRSDI